MESYDEKGDKIFLRVTWFNPCNVSSIQCNFLFSMKMMQWHQWRSLTQNAKKSEKQSNPFCCWKPCCKLNKCWRCLFWLRMPRFKYNHYPDCNHKLPEYLLINKLSNKETRLITVEKTWRKFRKKFLETYSN